MTFKRLWVDLETTGVNPDLHGIVQIAVIAEVGDTEETWVTQVRPFREDAIDERAAAVHGLNADILKTFPDPYSVFAGFRAFLGTYVDQYDRTDKFHFWGYRCDFDERFLRRFFEKMGNRWFGSFFHYPPVDVAVLAAHSLARQRHLLPDFKQKTVAAFLGIPVDESKLHEALYDLELTRAIYRCLTGSDRKEPAEIG